MKKRQALLWTLRILLFLAFAAAGGAKLAGAGDMARLFDAIGLGQWFRYATGLLELIAALLVLHSRLAPFGAFLMLCILAGALVTHLVVGGSALPALLLLALTAGFLAARRSASA